MADEKIGIELELNETQFKAAAQEMQAALKKIDSVGNELQKTLDGIDLNKSIKSLKSGAITAGLRDLVNAQKSAAREGAQASAQAARDTIRSAKQAEREQIKSANAAAKASAQAAKKAAKDIRDSQKESTNTARGTSTAIAAVLPGSGGIFSGIGAGIGTLIAPGIGTIIGQLAGGLVDTLVSAIGSIISITASLSKTAIQNFATSENLGQQFYYTTPGTPEQTQDRRRRISGQASVASPLYQQQAFLLAGQSGNTEGEKNALERMAEKIAILTGKNTNEGLLESASIINSLATKGGFRTSALPRFGVPGLTAEKFNRFYNKETGQNLDEKEINKQLSDKTGRYRNPIVNAWNKLLESIFTGKNTTGEEAIKQSGQLIQHQLQQLYDLPQTVFSEIETSNDPEVLKSANKIKDAISGVLNAFNPSTPSGIKTINAIADAFSQLGDTLQQIASPENIITAVKGLETAAKSIMATLSLIGDAAQYFENRTLTDKIRKATGSFNYNEGVNPSLQAYRAYQNGAIDKVELNEYLRINDLGKSKDQTRQEGRDAANTMGSLLNNMTGVPIYTPSTPTTQGKSNNNGSKVDVNVNINGDTSNVDHKKLSELLMPQIHREVLNAFEQAQQEGMG